MGTVGYPRTLVIGANGYLGSALLDALRKAGAGTWGTARRAVDGKWQYFELRDHTVDNLGLEEKGVEAAIIAAGMSGPICERQPRESWAVNVDDMLVLIEQLLQRYIVPVFLSSDQVFEGALTHGAYSDNDATKPKTEYGKQKAAVERHLQASGKPYLVVRMSKVFGLSKGDGTLLDEMARVLTAGQVVRAAYNQVFCPTRIDDVLRIVLGLMASRCTGVINVCSPETWSRYDLALALARELSCDESLVRRVSLHDIFPDFSRPEWTAMVCRNLPAEMRKWFTPMAECIRIVRSHYRA